MTLFLSLLPIYLLGNLHCIGMCGPLVAMIGQHRYRWHYFIGRTLSFALAGWLAGAVGEVLGVWLAHYHLNALTSILFGGIILVAALSSLCGWSAPGGHWLTGKLAHVSRALSALILQDRRWPTFLFGFFTVALPCGQQLIVYAACALTGDPLVGFLNGALFALFTSPSLLLAMHTHHIVLRMRSHYNQFIGAAGLIVAGLALCRGLAEFGWIPHLVLSSRYHLVIY